MFLYQYARDLEDPELERRLKGAAYVYVVLGLQGPMSQQTIHYSWRNRLSQKDRNLIKNTGERIRKIASEHGILREGEPRIEPDKVDDDTVITDEMIMDAVRKARDRGLDEFDTQRADNRTYEDLVYFERQAYISMKGTGTTTRSISDETSEFERASNRSDVPCPDSHLRTMKKTASPDTQTRLESYADGSRPPEWKQIRDLLLPQFHAGVENIIDELRGDEIREPVNVAIDTTPMPFYPSPWKNLDEVEEGDEWVEFEYRNGDTKRKYPKENFPEMVHGWKGDHERVYEMGTITIIGSDTPIVIGVEPVRKQSDWETEDAGDTTKARLVRRLLDQAEKHVDINKVFADRGFDVNEVRDIIDRRGYYHRIPKKKYADDWRGIEKVEEQPGADAAVNRDASLTVEGRTQNLSILYVPSSDEDGKYMVMPVNEDVEPERASGIVAQYDDRWQIEDTYKSLKANFIPRIASTDYRIRFLYFLIGCVLYNTWRMTNLLFRDAVDPDVHLGDSPPIPSREYIEFIRGVLFDPGD